MVSRYARSAAARPAARPAALPAGGPEAVTPSPGGGAGRRSSWRHTGNVNGARVTTP
jgi:hypothetical protein